MNKHSKYRPLLGKVQGQIMKAEIGVTGVYQVMLEALDEAETAELALREELAALRAESEVHQGTLRPVAKLVNQMILNAIEEAGPFYSNDIGDTVVRVDGLIEYTTQIEAGL